MAVQAPIPVQLYFRRQVDAFEALHMLAGDKNDMTSVPPPLSKKRARGVDVRAREDPMIRRHFQQPNMFCSRAVDAALQGSDGSTRSGRSTDDIDSNIEVYARQLRLGLLVARKRHCKALLSVAQQHATKRLKQKDMEIERARQLSVELELKMRQVAAESQIWFDLAKKNEDFVCSLRAKLEQVMEAAATPSEFLGADDALSCCFREEEAVIRPGRCKTCGEAEVCRVLMPCRHLCLCEDCESTTDTCPVCQSAKQASLQVAMS